MELIVMKVGMHAGIIGPEIFTMLMVMAILTTVMTTPLLSLFGGRPPAPATVARPEQPLQSAPTLDPPTS